jgi:uncharacterized membrane protein YkvA (DUF1232 family)
MPSVSIRRLEYAWTNTLQNAGLIERNHLKIIEYLSSPLNDYSMRKLIFILWRVGRNDLRIAWIALRHPDRPAWLLPALVVLGLYAIAPFNIVIPILGIIDDLVLVPLALHFLLTLLPSSIKYGLGSHRR